MRSNAIIFVATALAVAALAGCGGNDSAGSASELKVELKEQGGSGQHGTAILSATEAGETRVVLELGNPPAAAQPAHIHPGTCEQLDPTPAYALTNVQGGRSATTLPVSLEELRAAELVINVHKSQAEIATYAACGPLS
jgi:Cu/Zn superoxide dismutase